MSASNARLMKEARALFWPWCAVMAAGAFPLFWDPSDFSLGGLRILEYFSPAGFFVGLPLLAVLSFGDEFQHRTLSVLLSQPVNRMQIWREKLLVMACAVVSVGAVYFLSARSALHPQQLAVAGLYAFTMTASAAYWTLTARSTIGGLVLGWLPFGALELGGVILNNFVSGAIIETAGRLLGGRLPPNEASTILTYSAMVVFAYSALMLWLGARKLARFQVTGGLPGRDLVQAGPKLMPDALAAWFRFRPAGPYGNLIRKELRLLQPVWLMGLLLFLYLACLAILRLFPEPGEQVPPGMIPVRIALLFPLFTFTPLMALLAGCLSLGEERTSGTHSWHITLPVSTRRQWLIKLVVGLLSGLVCAALLPILVLFTYSHLFDTPFRLYDAGLWMGAAALVTLASFWCACIVSGTVRAALWVFPVLGALIAAVTYGGQTAFELVSPVASKLDLFADFGFTNTVANTPLRGGNVASGVILLFVLLPALLFAVWQSSRLFRTQVRDSRLSVIRALLPVALVAFLCAFSVAAPDVFVLHAQRQMWAFFQEASEAIAKIQPDPAQIDPAHPLQLTAEGLARASSLSDRTRRWLSKATITVASGKERPRYLVTIQLTGGPTCTLWFPAGRSYGLYSGVCK